MRLSEGAGILDVYDHEGEEGQQPRLADKLSDESGEEMSRSEDGEGEETSFEAGDYEDDEEEMEDDITLAQKQPQEFYATRQIRDGYSSEVVSEEHEGEVEDTQHTVDPSIVALAAAQQDCEIINSCRKALASSPSCAEVGDGTEANAGGAASGEIKKRVYEFLMMTDKGCGRQTSPPGRMPSPPMTYSAPALMSAPGDDDFAPISAENVTRPLLQPQHQVMPPADEEEECGNARNKERRTDDVPFVEGYERELISDHVSSEDTGCDPTNSYCSFLLDRGQGKAEHAAGPHSHTSEASPVYDSNVVPTHQEIEGENASRHRSEASVQKGDGGEGGSCFAAQSQQYPTEFSSHVIHNYESVYKNPSSSTPSMTKATRQEGNGENEEQALVFPSTSPSCKPPSPSWPSSSLPKPRPRQPGGLMSVINFPVEQEVGDESLMVAQEAARSMGSSLSSMMPPAFSSLQQPNSIPSHSQADITPNGVNLRPNTLAGVSSKVNERLGGKEAVKKIDESMEAAILRTQVMMLKDTTKNLRCSCVVDVAFKDPNSPRKPSPAELKRLKNIIAAELTLNEIMKSSAVVDLKSAEFFRESNEALEMVQRQQIMSNPLFADVTTASTVFGKADRERTQDFKENRQLRHESDARSAEVIDEDAASLSPAATTTSFAPTTAVTAAPAPTMRGHSSLHLQLFNILNPARGGKESPCKKLGDRVNFLNRLIHHKTSSKVTWSRLINLAAGISSQAVAVLFGDSDETSPAEVEPSPGWSSPAAALTPSLKLMTASETSKEMNMGSISVDILFGAASDVLERNLSRVCADIGDLAIYLNIPVVMLKWPREFTKTDKYKSVLMKSISSFQSKTSTPPMYIIDQISFDDDESGGHTGDDSHVEDDDTQDNMEILSDSDKRKYVNKVYNDIRLGKSQERDLMHAAFSSSAKGNSLPREQNVFSDHNGLDASAAYMAACSVIDYQAPFFENILSHIARYMVKQRHLINAGIIKLLRKAKLSIAVYCVKNKLSNVAANCDKKSCNDEMGNDAPMPNLMYRSAALKAPNSADSQTVLKARTEGVIDRQRAFSTPTSAKRPPPDILSRRIKRLKQWEMISSSDESEVSDEDAVPGFRDG